MYIAAAVYRLVVARGRSVAGLCRSRGSPRYHGTRSVYLTIYTHNMYTHMSTGNRGGGVNRMAEEERVISTHYTLVVTF